MDNNYKILIIGGGRLGKSLAYQLKAKGFALAGISSSNVANAQKAGELTGVPWGDTMELAAEANVIFITVPDDALGEVCDWLADNDAIKPGSFVFHCSGSQSSSLLAAAKQKGAGIASLHPLQSFSSFNPNANPFRNIIFTMEGDDAACQLGKELALALEAAHCFTIATEGKTLYHAAAVMVANYLITLFNNSADLLEKIGIDKSDAFTILAPLLTGTLKNLADNAPNYEMALTGPLMRGDIEVVKSHLAAIAAHAPEETVHLYKTLGRATIDVAIKQGLEPAKAAELERVLS